MYGDYCLKQVALSLALYRNYSLPDSTIGSLWITCGFVTHMPCKDRYILDIKVQAHENQALRPTCKTVTVTVSSTNALTAAS